MASANQMKFLVIQKDEAVLQAVAVALQMQWPDASVISARTADAGLNSFFDQEPDVVVVEAVLPGKSGLVAVKEIRSISEVPIVILVDRDDETSLVAGAHWDLTQLFREGNRVFVNACISQDRAHHLNQLHDGHRIEKVQANKAVRTLGRSRKLGDGNRRSIGAEDGVALHNPVERGIDFLFLVNILDDCFDDDVAVSQILTIGRALQAAANFLALLSADAALFRRLPHKFIERLLDGRDAGG